MARIRVGGSFSSNPIIKWSTCPEGFTLGGRFTGIRAGKFGPLADFAQEDGEIITAPVPTALRSDLERVKVGAEIEIIYGGLQHNKKTGRNFHAFQLFADSADIIAAPPRGARAQVSDPDDSDSEVPF